MKPDIIVFDATKTDEDTRWFECIRSVLDKHDNERCAVYEKAIVLISVDADTKSVFSDGGLNIRWYHSVSEIGAGLRDFTPVMFGYLAHQAVTNLLPIAGGRITLITRSESAMAVAKLAMILDATQRTFESQLKVEMYMASDDWSTLTDCNIFENHKEDSEET